MTSLSTHVLDLAHGGPARDVAVTLARDGEALLHGRTDADGRLPALAALDLAPGGYALTFAVAEYFRAKGVSLPDPPFLDRVTLAFGMAGGHYHVPLLVSPFGYSTYRGS